MVRFFTRLRWLFSGGLTKPQHRRSSHWPAVRNAFLNDHPTCAVCGTTKDLEVHHVRPVHLYPERELDPNNLITLCEHPARNHHLLFGHLLSFSAFNPHVRDDAALWQQKISNRPTDK